MYKLATPPAPPTPAPATPTPPRSGVFSGPQRPASPAWLQQPAPTPAPPAPQPQQTQPAPQQPQPQQQPQQPQQGGLAGMFDMSTPQNFGRWATMARPITQAVLGAGGMPALMGIYGAVSGNQDWVRALSPATREVQASCRFPLPVLRNGSLVMPVVEKKATPTLASLGYRGGSVPASTPTPTPHPVTSSGVETLLPQLATQEAVSRTIPRVANAIGIPQLAQRIGFRPTPTPALGAAAPQVGRLAAAGGVLRSGLLGFVPANAVGELLDYSGIYSSDPTKVREGNAHFFRRPMMYNNQQMSRDAAGNADTTWGFNPAAFGWNSTAHRNDTTPEGPGIGNRLSASWHALTSPIQSALTLNSGIRELFGARPSAWR